MLLLGLIPAVKYRVSLSASRGAGDVQRSEFV
jgi:hypothetical protein